MLRRQSSRQPKALVEEPVDLDELEFGRKQLKALHLTVSGFLAQKPIKILGIRFDWTSFLTFISSFSTSMYYLGKVIWASEQARMTPPSSPPALFG